MAHTEYTRESFTEPLENSETHIGIYLVLIIQEKHIPVPQKKQMSISKQRVKGEGKSKLYLPLFRFWNCYLLA